MTQISPNFSLAELTVTGQPYANVPNATEISNLKILCDKVLEPIRAHFGKPVKVNSAFRSAKVNAAVGSSPGSQHRKGEAADIEIRGVSNADLAKFIRDNLAFDQVILEAYNPAQGPNSGWVHVSYRAGRLRKSVLTMRLGSHGAAYSQGINA
jgi:zinc D-Ala-D-Ala carboxypeptidase